MALFCAYHLLLFCPETLVFSFCTTGSLQQSRVLLSHYDVCVCVCPLLSASRFSTSLHVSRFLYRNRSFLRIPLAVRPRFSSLRSLRFVLPRGAAGVAMPVTPPLTPLLPEPPSFACLSAVRQMPRTEAENPMHHMECKSRCGGAFYPEGNATIFRLLVACMLHWNATRGGPSLLYTLGLNIQWYLDL